MSLISSKQIYYVDSHNRSSGTHSDFSYALNLVGSYDSVVILQASIPKSYYLVQAGRNTFTLSEGGTDVTVTLPVGTYSRSSFQQQLINSLNAASPNNWDYIITIPNVNVTADTAKYTYQVQGNSSQPSFIIGDYLYEQLGFNDNTTYTFSSNLLESVNAVKFQLEDTLFINSDIVAGEEDNTLQEIFTDGTSDYGKVSWVCPSIEAYSKPLSSTTNGIFHFWISDEDGNPIDLNGQNVVFTLMIYKKENVYSLIKNILKMELVTSLKQ